MREAVDWIHPRSFLTGCAIVLRQLWEVRIEVELLHLFVLADGTNVGSGMFHGLDDLRDGTQGLLLLPSW